MFLSVLSIAWDIPSIEQIQLLANVLVEVSNIMLNNCQNFEIKFGGEYLKNIGIMITIY